MNMNTGRNNMDDIICKITEEDKGLLLEIIHRDEHAMDYSIALADDEIRLVHEATGKWLEEHEE
jgi:hypothetical protein